MARVECLIYHLGGDKEKVFNSESTEDNVCAFIMIVMKDVLL